MKEFKLTENQQEIPLEAAQAHTQQDQRSGGKLSSAVLPVQIANAIGTASSEPKNDKASAENSESIRSRYIVSYLSVISPTLIGQKGLCEQHQGFSPGQGEGGVSW